MLSKIMLASIAAASFGAALTAVSPSASAERWGGPRFGYGDGYRGEGYGNGPPPWAMRRGHWRRHYHAGPPAYAPRRPGHFYGRPVPRHPHW